MNNIRKNGLPRAVPVWMMPLVACFIVLISAVEGIATCTTPCDSIPWVNKSQEMYINDNCAPITVKWRVKNCNPGCNIEILSVETDLNTLDCNCNGSMSPFSEDMAAMLFNIELQILANYNSSPCIDTGNIVVRKPICWRIIQGTSANGFINKMEPCAGSECCERIYHVSGPGPGPGGPITITLLSPTTLPTATDCSSLVPSNECKDVCRNLLDGSGPWSE